MDGSCWFIFGNRHMEVIRLKILLIRHGETNENAAKCYLGHYDAVLNKHGRQQLFDLSQKLTKSIHNDTIFLYASDLSRTVESAEIIQNSLHTIVSTHPSLRELSFGDWECKTYEQILDQCPDQLTNWINDPFHLAPPFGETLQQLGHRVDSWFQDTVLKHHSTDTLIIVSHQGPIRWLVSKYYFGNIKKFWDVEGIQHGSGILMEFHKERNIASSVQSIG